MYCPKMCLTNCHPTIATNEAGVRRVKTKELEATGKVDKQLQLHEMPQQLVGYCKAFPLIMLQL